jgi:Tfp pilus assembly protein PilF
MLGFIQSDYDYDWKNAKLTLEKALKLNPNYTFSHIYYGNLLQFTGENTERGIEEIKKARSLDPLSVSINWVLGRNYYLAGKMDLAEEQLRKTIGISSQYPFAKVTLAFVLLSKKKYNEAFDIIKQIPLGGNITNAEYQGPILSYAYAISGNIERAKKELALWLNENSFKGHYQIAKIYTALKEIDPAISELNKAYQDREITMYFIKVDPVFSPLRSEPGFHELLKKMNLE